MLVKPAYTRTRVTTDIVDTKTKCVQSEATSSNINNIVARAMKTGKLPILNRQPLSELPDVGTYQDMLNKVVYSQQQFAKLPSSIRNAFDNKPENMLHAVELSKTDAGVHKQLEELGLLDAPPAPPAPPADPVDPKV